MADFETLKRRARTGARPFRQRADQAPAHDRACRDGGLSPTPLAARAVVGQLRPSRPRSRRSPVGGGADVSFEVVVATRALRGTPPARAGKAPAARATSQPAGPGRGSAAPAPVAPGAGGHGGRPVRRHLGPGLLAAGRAGGPGHLRSRDRPGGPRAAHRRRRRLRLGPLTACPCASPSWASTCCGATSAPSPAGWPSAWASPCWPCPGCWRSLLGKGTLHQPVKALAKAGGVVGAVVGVPLRAGLAGWGAGLVLAVVFFVACLIITATPVRAVAQAGRAVCGAGYRGGARLCAGVGELARRRRLLASATRHPSVRGPEVAARRRSARAHGRPAPPAAGAGVTEALSTPWRRRPGRDERPASGRPTAGQRPAPAPEAGFNWAGLAGGPDVGRRWRTDDADDADAAAPAGAQAGGRAGCRRRAARAEQLAIDLGLPKRPKPVWRLPPVALLRRSPPDRGRPPPGRGPGPDPRGRAGRPRGGDPAGGRHRGPERDPLRTGAGPGRQGAKGHRPATRHRLRPGRGRRPADRPDPGALGHRRRGAQPPAPDRGPGRHPGVARSRRRPPPPGGRRRPGHRRAPGAGQPGRDAPPAHRRRHRVGQVVLHQFDVDVGAHPGHPRPGAPDPGRPQAGGAGPLQRPAPPAHRAGDQPQEGGQRPALGRAGDGAPLRPAGRGRHARHNRLQRGLGPGRPGPGRRAGPIGPGPEPGRGRPATEDRRPSAATATPRGGARPGTPRRSAGAERPATSACRSYWWSSTSSTTS